MNVFIKCLRTRTGELGMTNVDVARRIGINDRTYAHYAAGRREPNLQTLVKIANALHTTPNDLLGIGDQMEKNLSKKDRFTAQAQAIVNSLDDERADLAVQLLRTIENNQLKN